MVMGAPGRIGRTGACVVSVLLWKSIEAFNFPLSTPPCGGPGSCVAPRALGAGLMTARRMRAPVSLALMTDSEVDQDMTVATLLKEKERLLAEQEVLLKKKRVLSRVRGGAAPAVVAAQSTDKVGAGSTKVAERPFEKRDMWGNAIKDAAKTPMKVPKKDSWGNDIKEEGADRQQTVTAGGDAGGEQTSRRGLLRRIVTGVGFSALSLVVVTILSFPRLERVAYLNFSLLFVDGTLLFGNKLLQAILSNDWATVAELTREAGPLDEGIMQPMFFFAAGNADDVQFTARISEVVTYAQEGIKSLNKIAAARPADNEAALNQWRVMREQINAFVRLANAKMPADLAPLSEVGE